MTSMAKTPPNTHHRQRPHGPRSPTNQNSITRDHGTRVLNMQDFHLLESFAHQTAQRKFPELGQHAQGPSLTGH